jgi:hypothetical protein
MKLLRDRRQLKEEGIPQEEIDSLFPVPRPANPSSQLSQFRLFDSQTQAQTQSTPANLRLDDYN